jgi:hypothetical protein
MPFSPSGTIVTVKNDNETKLDFGNGECYILATVNVKGVIEAIYLKKNVSLFKQKALCCMYTKVLFNIIEFTPVYSPTDHKQHQYPFLDYVLLSQ